MRVPPIAAAQGRTCAAGRWLPRAATDTNTRPANQAATQSAATARTVYQPASPIIHVPLPNRRVATAMPSIPTMATTVTPAIPRMSPRKAAPVAAHVAPPTAARSAR